MPDAPRQFRAGPGPSTPHGHPVAPLPRRTFRVPSADAAPLAISAQPLRTFSMPRSDFDSIPPTPTLTTTPTHANRSFSMSRSMAAPINVPPVTSICSAPTHTLWHPKATAPFHHAAKTSVLSTIQQEMPSMGEAEPAALGEASADGEGDGAQMHEDLQGVYWDLCRHRDGLMRLDEDTFIMQDWDDRNAGLKASQIPSSLPRLFTSCCRSRSTSIYVSYRIPILGGKSHAIANAYSLVSTSTSSSLILMRRYRWMSCPQKTQAHSW